MKTTTTKRKILFFVPSFPVLTETFIECEIEELVKRNNLDAWVLSLEGDKNELSDTLKSKVIYNRLSPLKAVLGLLFGIVRLGSVYRTIRLFGTNKASHKLSIVQVVKYLGYTRIISRIKPDLVVSHFLSEPSTICMFASQVLSLPYGISAHAKDVTVESEYVPQKMATAKFVLICNRNAKKSLIEQSEGVGINKIVLQHHGITIPKEFDRQSEHDDKSERPLVVSIGRLTEKKGHTYLIEASKVLKERGISHRVYIIGPGSMYNELNEFIDKLGLSDTVEILGGGSGLSHSETLNILKKADVGVFSGFRTPQGDEDGIPNVLFEYAAMKLPIVTTDTGSATDFVENEKTGLVVPQQNSYLLADAIEKLIFDKDLGIELTKNAFQKVSEEFNIEKNIISMERILL